MDALQQGVEVEPLAVGVGDDDLAVDDDVVGQGVAQQRQELGEVARDRPLAAARQLDVVAVAGDDAAEPVPLRLVQPAVTVGDRARQFGQHRLDR